MKSDRPYDEIEDEELAKIFRRTYAMEYRLARLLYGLREEEGDTK